MKTWTQFMDMHSGGGTKEPPYEYIYIEAPKVEAKVIFYHRFGHNPERVSCTCCGEDYSMTESNSLVQATGFERGCAFVYRRSDGTECEEAEAWQLGKGMKDGYAGGYEERTATRFALHAYQPLEEYLKRDNILVIYASDIQPLERVGDVPEQGYVWKD